MPLRETSLRFDHVAARFARTFPQLVLVPPRAGFTHPSIWIDDLIFQERLPSPAKRIEAATLALFPIRFVRMSTIELRRTSLAGYCWFRRAHVELRCLTITGLTGGDFASERYREVRYQSARCNRPEDLYWIGLGWHSISKKANQERIRFHFLFIRPFATRLCYSAPRRCLIGMLHSSQFP